MRQPITDANFDLYWSAHVASVHLAGLAGESREAASVDLTLTPPAVSIIGKPRDIESDMVDFLIERDTVTDDELRIRFGETAVAAHAKAAIERAHAIRALN